MSDPAPRRHILTVAVEDWFQVGAFHRLVQQGRWYRFETRVERNVHRALDLLDAHGARATFFVLGWIADELPGIVGEIVARGHEVASKGYYHRSIASMTPSEFRDDLVRSRDAIERAGGRRVHGYRMADGWFGPGDLWALDVLAEEGFAYDSSICPIGRRWLHEPWRRFLHDHRAANGRVVREVPLSSGRLLGVDVPVAGGNWIRQFPPPLMRAAFRRWERRRTEPFVLYFQVWELDPDQPFVQAAGPLTRLRHYRNLDRMADRIGAYLGHASFVGAAEYLGLGNEPIAVAAAAADAAPAVSPASADPAASRPGPAVCAVPPASSPPRTADEATTVPVTVVVPCHDEELVLPYLARTLADLELRLRDRWNLRYVFVDDGSTDRTWESLREIFGARPECRIVRHAENRGVARAILTGLAAADTEIVASIDCDCTYDPRQLEDLIPRLVDADLVTASPYHPQGEVRNVPGWRLFLSRGLSRLYRVVLPTALSTYTSCFRVYRRSSVVDLPIREEGFLGVAELLGRADLSGARVVECPAVLEVRMLGRSKMKVIRTIAGHLRLLARLAALRASGARSRRADARERQAET